MTDTTTISPEVVNNQMPKIIIGLLVFVGAMLIFLLLTIFTWKPWKYNDASYQHEISSRDSIIAEKDKRIGLLVMSNSDKDGKIKAFYDQDSVLVELNKSQLLILNRLQLTNESIKNRINAPTFNRDSLLRAYREFSN